jgi:putative FmdB family regulatory protein
MPIFEYECNACGTRFELLAPSRRARPDHPDCPECGADETSAVVSGCAVGRSSSPAGASCSIGSGAG